VRVFAASRYYFGGESFRMVSCSPQIPMPG
jgi:hypothetical protein